MTINGTDYLAPELAALLAGTPRYARPRSRVFPGRPGQVAHARYFVRRALAAHGPAGDAALLTSELATNAIQHTASGQGGTFEIVICRRPAAVRIAVIDAGSPSIPTLTSPDCLNASGRGLALVEALARQWGHQGNQRSRIVWFDLDLPVTGHSPATADPRHPGGETTMSEPGPAAPARYDAEHMRAIAADLAAHGLTTHLTDSRAGLDLTAVLSPSSKREAQFWIDEEGYAELRYWNRPGTSPAQVTAIAIRALHAVTSTPPDPGPTRTDPGR